MMSVIIMKMHVFLGITYNDCWASPVQLLATAVIKHGSEWESHLKCPQMRIGMSETSNQAINFLLQKCLVPLTSSHL